MIKIDKIESICILRLSAIGDVTHVLPVIATLQKANPNIKITWIIGKIEYKLMQGLEGVEFIVFDKKKGRRGYKLLKQSLYNQIFDVLLQMQYSFRANRAAWTIKAKVRVGFDKKRSRELHGFGLTHRIKAVDKQHVLDGFMEFCHVLGVNNLVYKWNISVDSTAIEYANNLLINGKSTVVISPFSSKKTKNWSNTSYAAIIDYIVEKYDSNIILCGSPNPYEVEASVVIEDLAQYSVTNTTGKDSLKQLFALFQRVDLVISPDSGPMHMANAAGTPVIGLMASTTAKRSGAYSYQHLAIDCFSEAADKFLNKSADKIRWGGQINEAGVMDLITVDSVKEKIDSVLMQLNQALT